MLTENYEAVMDRVIKLAKDPDAIRRASGSFL